MIEFYNGRARKRPTFEQMKGRIVMVSDMTTWGGVKRPVLVIADDGRAVLGREIASEYSYEMKRHNYSQNGELRDGEVRIDKSGIRVVCDTVAEAEALMEIGRVHERECWESLQAAKSRLAAMEGASFVSSGPVVLEATAERADFVNKISGEAVHSIKENRE